MYDAGECTGIKIDSNLLVEQKIWRMNNCHRILQSVDTMKLCVIYVVTLIFGAQAFAPVPSNYAFGRKNGATKMYAEGDTPFAVIVNAVIHPDRMAEFLEMIKTNAENSRKEPGCVRFDVLRSQDANNEFFFYELYENEAAIAYHKEQPHYKLWADFKASGGVLESKTFKTDAEFLT